MIKKLIILAALILNGEIKSALASIIDTSYTANLVSFTWSAISDVDKVMQYEKQKDLTKRSIQQSALA